MPSAQSIDSRLNYLARTETRPVSHMPKLGVPVAQSATYEKRSVQIHDARMQATNLDEHGFTLVPEPLSCGDFFNHARVVEQYYPRVEALVKAHTDAVRVIAFDHNVRVGDAKQQARDGVREPVRVVHNDYTVRSGPIRLRELLPNDADVLLKRRFAVINVWRPIIGPVESQPLGVCDASSMQAEDFVATDLEYGERTGEVYQITWNPEHRWYFYSQMRADEAMLLKCYDSTEHGCARFTAHSAFTHPESTPESAPRQSIETRTMVFF